MKLNKFKPKHIIRTLFRVRKNESFDNAIVRHKLNFRSIFPYKKYGCSELEAALREVGLTQGDCVMVHSAWRPFAGFSGSPKDVIDILIKIIGDDGTLLMPCNASNKIDYFDVKNSECISGVLSSTFLKYPDAKRSCGSHFSVCGRGKYRNKILDSHIDSEYGFDDKSPYGIFSSIDGKMIFLGLGDKPTKISIFHRVGYLMREEKYFKSIFKNKKKIIVKDEFGNEHVRYAMQRSGVKNSSRNIRNIFMTIPKENRRHINLGLLDIVCVDTIPALKSAINQATNHNIYMYK